MARLAIYNGNALVRELDVPEGTLRVGRNDQNDIVLIDPGKAVSRFHAELRIGPGHCTIVDLNSQNGTWVAGRRLPKATLLPGQAAVLGTHRLVYMGDASDAEGSVASPAPVAPSPSVIEFEAAAQAVPTPQGAAAGDVAPSDATVSGIGQGEPKAAAVSVREHPAARALPASSLSVKPRVRVRRALLLLAGCLCLAAAGVTGGVFWWPGSHAAPAAPPPRAVELQPPAPVLGGPPTETPTNVTSPPAVSSGAGPAAAAATVTATPPVAPAASANGLAAATSPANDAAGTRRTSVPTAPRKEKATEQKSQEANTALLLERARAAVRRGDYPAALGFVQPIMRVDAGNPEALDLLAAIRSQGHDAFRRGRQLDAAGRAAEAIPFYQKAVKLLPADHPSVQAARERLTALR